MPNYENGKIYKLTCSETDKVYIGSTTRTLAERMCKHREKENDCASKDFINPKIELIETYPCETKEQLLWKEREWIENTDCVNKVFPIVTKEEYNIKREKRRKEHREENRERLNAVEKKYRENNQDRINEKFTCECGGKYVYSNKARHLKSKKHLNYVSSKE